MSFVENRRREPLGSQGTEILHQRLGTVRVTTRIFENEVHYPSRNSLQRVCRMKAAQRPLLPARERDYFIVVLGFFFFFSPLRVSLQAVSFKTL